MSEHELLLDQAIATFVERYHRGEVSSVSAFLETYPADMHDALLALIREYLELETELKTLPIDEEALAALAATREEVIQAVMTPASSLGEVLRERDLLPDEFAEQTNLPTDFVGRLERGTVDLKHSPQKLVERLLQRIAEALNLSPLALWPTLLRQRSMETYRMRAEDGEDLGIEEAVDVVTALEQSAELTPGMRDEWLRPELLQEG